MTSLTANLPIRQIKRLAELKDRITNENESLELKSIELIETEDKSESSQTGETS